MMSTNELNISFSFLVHPHLNINSRWTQNGVTVAGGHGQGNALNQLDWPEGLDIDDEGVLFITDIEQSSSDEMEM